MKKLILFYSLVFFFSIQVIGQTVTAKMYFSTDKDPSSAPKRSFNSGEFIYGRVEFTGGTLNDFFRLRPSENKRPSHLQYTITVNRDGKQLGTKNRYMYLLLREEDKAMNKYVFDILAEPESSTSVVSFFTDFNVSVESTLYEMITKERFPSNGTYLVMVQLHSESLDGWGNKEDKSKWPFVRSNFEFRFSESDIANLQKNRTAAYQFLKENAFKLTALPDVFSNPAKVTDPKLTQAKLMAILKRDLPGYTILKMALAPWRGDLWQIMYTTDRVVPVPRHRALTPDIHIAYEEDGQCRVGAISLIEPYLGGGKYGPLKVAPIYTINGKDKLIDCDLIK